MNIPDRLTAEEREFARLLGPTPVDDGPPPAIDAAILAMAAAELKPQPGTAQVSAPPPSNRHARAHRRRRPLGLFAAAASMLLAVGIAWQLRPLPPERELSPAAEADAPVAITAPTSSLPAAPPPASAAAADAAAPMESATAAQDAVRAPTPVAKTAAAGAARRQTAAMDIAEGGASAAAAQSSPAPAPAPAPASIASPMLPAPPAPMAAAAASPASTPMSKMSVEPSPSADRQETGTRRVMPRRQVSPAPQDSVEEIIVTGSHARQTDVESDAALPQRQWLQRIQQRQREGDLEGARASLRRFVLTHPQAHVPRPLRPLLQD